jgi:hypothetical protein
MPADAPTAEQAASAVVVIIVFIAALIKAWKHPHD